MILLIAAEEHKLFIRGEPGERYTTAASAVAQGSSATRAVVNKARHDLAAAGMPD